MIKSLCQLCKVYVTKRASFPDSSAGKESLAMQETLVPLLGQGDPLEKSGYSLCIPRLPCGSDSKEIHLQCERPGFDPWVGKILWRRAWQPTPIFLPGESLWTKGLAGYSSWGSQRAGLNWVTRHSTAHVTAVPPTQPGNVPLDSPEMIPGAVLHEWTTFL